MYEGNKQEAEETLRYLVSVAGQWLPSDLENAEHLVSLNLPENIGGMGRLVGYYDQYRKGTSIKQGVYRKKNSAEVA